MISPSVLNIPYCTAHTPSVLHRHYAGWELLVLQGFEYEENGLIEDYAKDGGPREV